MVSCESRVIRDFGSGNAGLPQIARPKRRAQGETPEGAAVRGALGRDYRDDTHVVRVTRLVARVVGRAMRGALAGGEGRLCSDANISRQRPRGAERGARAAVTKSSLGVAKPALPTGSEHHTMRYGFVTTSYTSAVLVQRARDMRRAPTASERILWEELRHGRLGVRFRRQVVLGRFIVDFFAPSVRLAVEVDGAGHAARAGYDAVRDRALAELAVRTLRVPAWRVERDVAAVVGAVRAALDGGIRRE